MGLWRLSMRGLASSPAASTLHTITMNTNQTDFFPVAARLALELECLLLSCKDTAAVSKWWDSAHEALQQFRGASQALERAQADVSPVAWRYLTPTGWHATTSSGKALGAAKHHPMEPLYIHPSLPAAQGLSEEARQLLENAASCIMEAVRYEQESFDSPPEPAS